MYVHGPICLKEKTYPVVLSLYLYLHILLMFLYGRVPTCD